MKNALFALAALFIFQQSFGQSDSTNATTDSTQHNKYIDFGPNFTGIDPVGYGYFSATVSDPQTFHLSAGLDVVNTLRGQAPNLVVSPGAMGTSVAPRLSTPVYVIDGLPFNSGITSYYNFNAFEYQRVAVINSGNAAARFGGAGLGSVVLLERKNGANISTPTFEFNSYTTYTSNTSEFWGGESAKEELLRLTNAIAYLQDFGKVDTRISYNYTAMPEIDKSNTLGLHAVNINTGLELGSRFNARLIFDQYQSTTTYNQYSGDGPESIQSMLQGNLALSYQVLDWLKLSSQSSLSRAENEFTGGLQYNDALQKRSLANVYLTIDKALSQNFSLNFYTGYQFEKYSPRWREQYDDFFDVEFELDYDTKSVLSGISMNVNNFLTTEFTLRNDQYINEENTTWTVAGAILLDKALGLSGVSLWKIRTNYGTADVIGSTNYPYEFDGFFLNMPWEWTAGNNFEAGMDLEFAQKKASLSVSRFKNVYDDYYYLNAFDYQYINLGEVSTSGWEFLFTYIPVKTDKSQLLFRLNYGTTDLEHEEMKGPYLISPFAGAPEMETGLYTEVYLNKWFFAVLLNVTNYDEFDLRDDFNVPLGSFGGTSSKVRDITVGYTVNSLNSRFFKSLRLSISGRNLISFNSDVEYEKMLGRDLYLKSASLSAGFTF
jgi:hypothetical protein